MKVKRKSGGGFGEYKGRPDEPLEPVYPLEEMLMGGVAARAVKPLAQYVKTQADLLSRPKVRNRLYNETIGGPEHIAGDVSKKYGGRNVFSPDEIEDIKSSGFMRPRQSPGPKGKAPKQDKYFTMSDNPNQTLRVRSDKIPKGRAVRREDVEIYDEAIGGYKPLKKGGLVKSKSASRRADGIAKKGKTRGRII